MSRHLLPNRAAALLLLTAVAGRAAAQAEASLADFSLEQLSEIVVTSVSRQETRLGQAPASLYVISAADIRRAGAATLPEALRLAPNLQVARVDAHDYAISARGFSSALANKLLVLIDGRSVYSPLFSGVFWDTQDVVMSDIERIEVISGPGATIWGANAVNGVINIITKSARDSQGGLAVARASEDGGSATLRYGARLPNGGHYRIYGKGYDVGDTGNEAGTLQESGWRRRQAGFRADWEEGKRAWTVSGDAYQGTLDEVRRPDTDISGGNLLGRMTAQLGEGSALRLQAYFDHASRDEHRRGAQRLDTIDLEAQHGVQAGAAHRLAWGGGYRYSRDRIRNGQLAFLPAERHLHWGNLFVQDEVALSPALRATAGVKIEHNTYTGAEGLPSFRLAWNAGGGSLLWGAASRTVRAPSRVDRDLFVPDPRARPGAPAYLLEGGPGFVAETARVLEAGYRAQPAAALSYSLTMFHSDYDRLRTLEVRPGLPAMFENRGRGRARGVELWANWQPLRSWRLSGGAVLQDIDTELKEGSHDVSGGVGLASNDPRRYWSLRSSHELGATVQADLSLRYVGSLPDPAVPGYHELDARLAWQALPTLELALAGRNLLHRSHAEFGAAGARQLFHRTVWLTATLRF